MMRCLTWVRAGLALALLAGPGCDRGPRSHSEDRRGEEPAVRGEPIRPVVNATGLPAATAAGMTNGVPPAAGPPPGSTGMLHGPEIVQDGFVALGWDRLSGFKFDVYEFYSETNTGRALLKSDDTIPADVKIYDGRKVTVSGFVLPLRIRKQLVTEFLLLRDQGTCCFGAQAKINHFMRVKLPGGFRHDATGPVTVSGTLRVGEIYIQGYLTGIYQLEAEKLNSAGPAIH